MSIRVFLVDDHDLVRQGIARIVDAEPELEIVGEAATLDSAARRIAAVRPDVAVIDVRLADGNGIDLCRDVRSAHPETACLILTGFDDDEAARAAVLAGAAGYVLKNIRGNGLVDAIRTVHSGRTTFPAGAARALRGALTEPSHDTTPLTTREEEILDLIVDGLTNRQIGERLGIAEKTVKNNVTALLGKLHLEHRTQAAVYRLRSR